MVLLFNLNTVCGKSHSSWIAGRNLCLEWGEARWDSPTFKPLCTPPGYVCEKNIESGQNALFMSHTRTREA